MLLAMIHLLVIYSIIIRRSIIWLKYWLSFTSLKTNMKVWITKLIHTSVVSFRIILMLYTFKPLMVIGYSFVFKICFLCNTAYLSSHLSLVKSLNLLKYLQNFRSLWYPRTSWMAGLKFLVYLLTCMIKEWFYSLVVLSRLGKFREGLWMSWESPSNWCQVTILLWGYCLCTLWGT